MLSSPALGAVIGILPDGGNLTVGFRHKLLQPLFKQLVSGFGCRRRGRCRLALPGGIIFPTGTIVGTIAELGCGGFQTLNGKIDFAAVYANDNNLDILTFRQVLANITNLCFGDLRDMYHAGLVLGQRNKCTEIGNGFYFAFQNGSHS